MDNDKKKVVWIIGIVLAIFLFSQYSTEIFASYPQEYQTERQKFGLIRDFELKEGSTTVVLPDGVDLDEVYKIVIEAKGCYNDMSLPNQSSTEQPYITVNGKENKLSFQNCEFLFYSDQGGEPEYQHYETKSVTITGISSRKVDTYLFVGDNEVISSKLMVWEWVDCTRSSHCPKIILNGEETQSFCDVKFHKCTVDTSQESVEDAGEDLPYEEQPKFNLIEWIQNNPLLSILIGIGVILFIWMSKR